MGIRIKSFESPDMIAEMTHIVINEDDNLSFVIDPGTINSEIEKIINDTELKYIILTHAHMDHIAALPKYRELWPDAFLVINENDADMLASADINGSYRIYRERIEYTADINPKDGETLEFGNQEIRFIHTPGHTKGGMCIAIGNDLFSGDTLFWRSVGRTDLYGGDWDILKHSIQNKLFTLPDEIVVYPGHGGSTTIGEEKRANPFV